MPPRYAYWTIIVDDQPTAFRSAAVEELMPTFNRLKSKHPSAVLKWFQNGKLWNSRLDARETQERRRQEGPKPASRSGGSFRPSTSRQPDKRRRTGSAPRQSGEKLGWKPKGPSERGARPKLEWAPRQGPPTTPAEAETGPPRRSVPNRRDAKWRPGGDHKDPRQKYKDAKKAKWTRFKEAIHRPRTSRKP